MLSTHLNFINKELPTNRTTAVVVPHRSLKDLFLSVQERVGNRQKRRPKQNIESADSTLGLMDEETREQVLDLLTLMLTFEPAQRCVICQNSDHPIAFVYSYLTTNSVG